MLMSREKVTRRAHITRLKIIISILLHNTSFEPNAVKGPIVEYCIFRIGRVVVSECPILGLWSLGVGARLGDSVVVGLRRSRQELERRNVMPNEGCASSGSFTGILLCHSDDQRASGYQYLWPATQLFVETCSQYTVRYS
jgi:hypothetical protein